MIVTPGDQHTVKSGAIRRNLQLDDPERQFFRVFEIGRTLLFRRNSARRVGAVKLPVAKVRVRIVVAVLPREIAAGHAVILQKSAGQNPVVRSDDLKEHRGGRVNVGIQVADREAQFKPAPLLIHHVKNQVFTGTPQHVIPQICGSRRFSPPFGDLRPLSGATAAEQRGGGQHRHPRNQILTHSILPVFPVH